MMPHAIERISTDELRKLLADKTLHDSRGELCVESQAEDQTYLMSVPAVPGITDTEDVVKTLAAEVIELRQTVEDQAQALRQERDALKTMKPLW